MIDIVTRLIECAKRAMPNDSGKEHGLAGLCLEAARELENARREAASWEQQASDRTDDAVRFAQERDALKAKVDAMERQKPICTVVDEYNADGLSSRISEYLRAGADLYLTAGAQLAPEVANENDLYCRLHSMSKSMESSGFIDEYNNPDAYGTVLDAMDFVLRARPTQRPAPSVPDGCWKQAVEEIADDGFGAVFKRLISDRAAMLAAAPEIKP